jgi:hypothetical protein
VQVSSFVSKVQVRQLASREVPQLLKMQVAMVRTHISRLGVYVASEPGWLEIGG